MKMTSGQQQGFRLFLFVCHCFVFGFLFFWGEAVLAFDLTCKFYLDKQLGFKLHAHKHMCKYKQTHNQKEKKNKKTVTISIWIIIQCKLLVKIKSAPTTPPTHPQADHLFCLVKPYYKILTYMNFISFQLCTEEEEKSRKKERPNTYLVYYHSNFIEMVLIFNETSWQRIRVAWHTNWTKTK